MENNALIELAAEKKYKDILCVYQQYSIESVAKVADFLQDEQVYKVAIPLYQYLLKQKEAADLHYSIGKCYGKIHVYEASLFHLNKAFEPEDDRREGANYYAYILGRNRLMDRAYEWYHKAFKSGYKNDIWTLAHYAYFLEKYNKTEEAKKVYEDVITRNPAYSGAVKRYAIFLLKENEPEQSMKLMQGLLEKYQNNSFVKLNHLEYLIIRGVADEYDEYFKIIRYEQSPLILQVGVDLLDYFWRYLINGKSDAQKVKDYERKVKFIKDSFRRDFDDLNEILAAKNGDIAEWKRLTKLLVN